MNKLKATIASRSSFTEATFSGSQPSSQEGRVNRLQELEENLKDEQYYNEWLEYRIQIITVEGDLMKLVDSGILKN